MEERAARCRRQHGKRVGVVSRAIVSALERVDCDIDRNRTGVALPRAERLANPEHRRLVALALANRDTPVEGDGVEDRTHRGHRRRVSRLVVAAAAHAAGGDSGCLGGAQEFRCQTRNRLHAPRLRAASCELQEWMKLVVAPWPGR